MKKLICCAVAALLLLLPCVSMAAGPYDGSNYADVQSYLLLDTDTGQRLAEKNVDERVYPASTTKLMTALLLLEEKGLSGEVTVGNELEDLSSLSSLMGIEEGETVSVNDLFYGLLVCSGNDAALTIAKYVSGEVDAFVDLMNSRAAELGMGGTRFVNPHGMYMNEIEGENDGSPYLGKNHYTTTSDMALLVMEAIKHGEILDAAKSKTYTLSATNVHTEPREIESTNRLIYTSKEFPEEAEFIYAPATGLKTGLIANIQPEDALIPLYGCLAASAEKDGLRLAALVYGDMSGEAYGRWRISKDLFEYGFNNYAKVDLRQYIEPVEIPGSVTAGGGTEEITLYSVPDPATMPPTVLLDADTASGLADGSIAIETQAEPLTLTAPVEAGADAGTIIYTLLGQEICRAPLRVLSALGADGAGAQTQPQANPGQTPAASNVAGATQPAPFNSVVLIIAIPAAIVAALLVIRAVNLTRRKRRRR